MKTKKDIKKVNSNNMSLKKIKQQPINKIKQDIKKSIKNSNFKIDMKKYNKLLKKIKNAYYLVIECNQDFVNNYSMFFEIKSYKTKEDYQNNNLTEYEYIIIHNINN